MSRGCRRARCAPRHPRNAGRRHRLDHRRRHDRRPAPAAGTRPGRAGAGAASGRAPDRGPRQRPDDPRQCAAPDPLELPDRARPRARHPPELQRRRLRGARRQGDRLERRGSAHDRLGEHPHTRPCASLRDTGRERKRPERAEHARRRLRAAGRHTHRRRRVQLPDPVHPRASDRAAARANRRLLPRSAARIRRRERRHAAEGRRRARLRDPGLVDRQHRAQRAAALGRARTCLLSLRPADAAGRSHPAGRLHEPWGRADHGPPRHGALALQPSVGLRCARPPLARDDAPERRHRGQRRLPGPRRRSSTRTGTPSSGSTGTQARPAGPRAS